ncbi:hypothetical protein CDEST_09805 [Colletotrichum destructivum]|uniref:Cytochrome P450 n=1 Tax=Colletotrichum destructivum TaxID=34406 RepID=A0AAX4IPI1_9PEZI|nr:hypothetical protein CDEST_09805 [Colletotrichum destructivum]
MEASIDPQLVPQMTGSNSTASDGRLYGVSSVYVVLSTVLAVTLAALSFLSKGSSKSTPLPWVNRPSTFDILQMGAKYRFLMGAGDMVKKGFEDFSDSPGFRMVADAGEIVMLDPKFAAELKNDHRVDFVKLFLRDFHEGIPGFDFTQQGARDAKILREVTKSQLTHHLSRIALVILS